MFGIGLAINNGGLPRDYAELNLLSAALDPRITFSRASTKSYFGVDGLLKTAAVNECPLEYDPSSARTNLFPYSTFGGALTGLVGTGGSLGSGLFIEVANGLTTTVNSVGLDGGLPYIEVRVSGTPSATAKYQLRTGALATAPLGSSYTGSMSTQVVAGAVAGALSVSVIEAMVAYPGTANAIVPQAGGYVRTSATRVVTQDLAPMQLRFTMQTTISVPVDVTFRLAAWQFEKGSAATAFIKTSGAVVSVCSPVGRSFWEARTNYLLNSGAPATWSTNGTPTLTANASQAPDGTTTMYRIASSAASGAGKYKANVTTATSGLPYTYTLFARYVSGTPSLSLTLEGAAYPVTCKVVFNTLTGAIISQSGAAITATYAKQLPNGVWRLGLTAPAGAAASLNITAYSGTTDDMAVDIWGGQVEQAATFGPYIPTTSAAVTRAADVAVVNDVSTIRFNPTQGTIYVEYALGSKNTNVSLVRFDDNAGGSSDNFLWLRYSSTALAQASVSDSTSTQVSTAPAGYAAPGIYKRAMTYSATRLQQAINGALPNAAVTTGMVLPSNISQLRVGQSINTEYPCCSIIRLRYYPKVLLDAQIQALTT